MRRSREKVELSTSPLAIDARVLPSVAEFVTGNDDDPSEEAKRLDPRSVERVARAPGDVSVIPIHGVMLQRSFWAASMEDIGQAVSAAAGDDAVKAIVLHVASPGGTVYGLPELADRIFSARQVKPVIAHADSYAASAAYWAASQATEIIVSPGGDVGSIGVYALHEDVSGFLDKVGLKETLVYAGKYKVEGNPFEPLDDEARETMQSRVDAYYQDFLRAVARGRGKDVDHVAEKFGQGRMVRFDEAVKRGMADRVATFEETLARFGGTSGRDASMERRGRAVRVAQAKNTI